MGAVTGDDGPGTGAGDGTGAVTGEDGHLPGRRRHGARGARLRWSAAGRALGGLSPAGVGLVATALALGFVCLRLLVAADGDVSRFVVAGEMFVDREAVAATGTHLHVFESPGYDGQFFWRLAVDPAAWDDAHAGVTLDSPYRLPRIGYPLLAHLVAGGRAGPVAGSLVAVNVAAVGVAAWAAAHLARRAGHPAAWGLAVVGAPGLVMALGRDLAECVTVACLLGGVLALDRRRPLLAAAAWSYAVLSREQALLTVGAYGLWRLGLLARRRARPGAADAAWVAPAVAFAAWQLTLWRATGELPAAAAGGTNLVPPFTDLVGGLAGWATGELPRLHVAAPAQLAATVGLTAVAVRAAPRVAPERRYLVIALGSAALAATCLAESIWRDPSDLRHLVDLSVLAPLVLLSDRRPPPMWTGVLIATVCATTVAVRVVAI